MNNYERITQHMSVDEMAEWLLELKNFEYTKDGIKQWLLAESEE